MPPRPLRVFVASTSTHTVILRAHPFIIPRPLYLSTCSKHAPSIIAPHTSPPNNRKHPRASSTRRTRTRPSGPSPKLPKITCYPDNMQPLSDAAPHVRCATCSAANSGAHQRAGCLSAKSAPRRAAHHPLRRPRRPRTAGIRCMSAPKIYI